MVEQHGTLVVLVRDFRTEVDLNLGQYFALKVGDNCIRFNQVQGELMFPIDVGESSLPIELILFQRRPQLKNSVEGRRRDLVDRCEVFYNRFPVSKSEDSYLEWRSIHLRLRKSKMTFVIDVEFYPAVPFLPSKDDETTSSSCDSEQTVPELELEEDRAQGKKLPSVPPKDQANGEDKNRSNGHEGKKLLKRKRDKFKALLIGSSRERVKERTSSSVVNSNTIYYDLQSSQKVDSGCASYRHGESSLAQPQTSLRTKEISNLFDKDLEAHGDEVLPLDVSPREFFNDVGNRVKHNQGMNFTNVFSSHNVRLTNYIGKGRWGEPVLSQSLLNWYLQPGVNPVPGPPLPPKCPRGMLWEEFYLLNHELYSQTVLRYQTSDQNAGSSP